VAEFPLTDAGERAAVAALEAAVARAGFDIGVAHRLAVILDEVLANVRRHDRSIAAGDVFSLELHAGPDGMTMDITDPGAPFDPLAAPAGPAGIGGHGLKVIKGLPDDACYARVGRRNRLRVFVRASAGR